jgi:hypothetical protein
MLTDRQGVIRAGAFSLVDDDKTFDALSRNLSDTGASASKLTTSTGTARERVFLQSN